MYSTAAKPIFHPTPSSSPPSNNPTASRRDGLSRPRASLLSKHIRFITKSAVVLIGAGTALAATYFTPRPAWANTIPVSISEEAERVKEDEASTLATFLNSNPEAVDSLKSLLQEKLQTGHDEEALKILERLVAAQPRVIDWKFLMARLLNEMGQVSSARKMFEEILSQDPLSFEALFENALLMDRCGEGETVIRRLQEALNVAIEGNKAKEARDVRFIMAQVLFLQKDVDEALKTYESLTAEDPHDFRPYFCRWIIYNLLGRDEDAREQFAKYRELSPRKFDVAGYVRTPLSRIKIFGDDS